MIVKATHPWVVNGLVSLETDCRPSRNSSDARVARRGIVELIAADGRVRHVGNLPENEFSLHRFNG